FNSLRTSAAQLQGITQTASAMVVNLEQMSEKLSDKDNAVGTLTNDKEVADEIRQVITNLNEASLKLDENMEALQHNFLLRGFFKKKRKAEEKAQKEQQQEEQLQ
ncbi:MAG TPA: MCE family protein, partial [Candidatus Sphingobacterium stercoripullorum]|nr:MCE family protein [Candidatus Sphingobacterium stercoripullorum]